MKKAEQTEKPSIPLFAVVCVVFFATGLAGLMHKVVWGRTFALQMGHTVHASVTLLSVLLGGLALGSFLGGRFTPTGRRALVVVAICQLVIGVYCLLLPTLQRAADPAFSSIYQNLHVSLPVFSLAQFGFVALLLCVPTVAMGAILPILSRVLVSRMATLGRTVGVLFGVGAVGGGCGVVLAGFVLLPELGVLASSRVAIAINVVAALLAFAGSFLLAARREPKRGTARSLVSSVRGRKKAEVVGEAVFGPIVLLIGVGLCGLAVMVCQTAWVRAATLAIGSSTYSATLVLAMPVLGIGIGAALFGWMSDRPWGRYALGAVATVAGLTAVLSASDLGTFPIRMARVFSGDGSFASIEWAAFFDISLMLLLPTLCIGGVLPLATRLGLRTYDDVGRVVGHVFAVVALGSVLGAILAGYGLVTSLGIRWTLLAGGLVLGAVGALFVERENDNKKVSWLGAVGVVALVACAAAYVPKWEPSILAGGPFHNSTRFVESANESDDDIRAVMQRDFVSFDEGVSSLVAVTKEGDGRLTLLVDGSLEAISYRPIQDWQGHLPMVLRPSAEDVLLIGLGAGHTLSCVECYEDGTSIDVVERSPGVGRAAREHFGPFTANALDDPRASLIIGDGRSHLAGTDKTYDVIVVRASTSRRTGTFSLLTRESFSSMKQRLKPNGLACVSLPARDLSLDSFLAICKTWGQQWDHASLWAGQGEGDYLLVGSHAPLSVDYDALFLALNNSCVAGQLRRVGVPTPAHFMSYLLAVDDVLIDLADGAEINTDDNARVEFDSLSGIRRDAADAGGDLGELYKHLHDRRVEPWAFVATRRGDGADYLRDKQRSATMLADQPELMRAQELPLSERRVVIEAVLERNPHDSRAARALDELSNR